jgi:NAD(P)H dehydrogenase (quinone)
MAKVTVVYHSGYGHTKKVAEAVLQGVGSVKGVEARLVNVDDFKGNYVFDDITSSDGIIFGCPTYMGGPSAPFKAFIDAASKVWFVHGWKDKIAAGFTNSGSFSGDKFNTLNTLWVNAMQHGMVWVGLGMFPPQASEPAGPGPEDINRVGAFGGLMTASAVKADLSVTPPPGDLKTAEQFGARVAETTVRWVKGKA